MAHRNGITESDYDLEELWGKTHLWSVWYHPGWCSGQDGMGALHSDLEYTKADILKDIRNAQRCTCDYCKTRTE